MRGDLEGGKLVVNVGGWGFCLDAGGG